jgi:phosphomannomutase
MPSYLALYASFLKKFVAPATAVKVVFDCSNGGAGLVVKRVLARHPLINFHLINARPDGRFPGHGPNPTVRGAGKQLAKEIVSRRADLGVIFDADGDRALFFDERGKAVEVVSIFCLLAPSFEPPYLVDVALGRTPLLWLEPDWPIIEGRTGHFFIKEMMRRRKIQFAAEASGHYYFKDFYEADSGILAALLVMNRVSFLKSGGLSFSRWRRLLPLPPRLAEKRLPLKRGKAALAEIEKYYRRRRFKISKLDGLSAANRSFWFNLRPSQTEPILRLNAAATTKALLIKETARLLAWFK